MKYFMAGALVGNSCGWLIASFVFENGWAFAILGVMNLIVGIIGTISVFRRE